MYFQKDEENSRLNLKRRSANEMKEDQSTPVKKEPLSICHQSPVSPQKYLDRPRCHQSDQFETFVIFDFEMKGLREYEIEDSRDLKGQEITEELIKHMKTIPIRHYPRIKEMSFLVLNRSDMLEYMDNEGKDTLDPSDYGKFYTNYVDCKNTGEVPEFSEEWKRIHQILVDCPKPALLVAHNGWRCDLLLLYNELRMANMLESHPIPNQVFMVDSLNATFQIDLKYAFEINEAIRIWKTNHENHELLTIEKILADIFDCDFSTAKRKMMNLERIEKRLTWKLRIVPSERKGMYTQQAIYGHFFGKRDQKHKAEDDVKDLLRIISAYGRDFLAYAHDNAFVIPF